MKETRDHLLSTDSTTEPKEQKVLRVSNCIPELPVCSELVSEHDAEFVLTYTNDENYAKMKTRSKYLTELANKGIKFKAVVNDSTNTQFILLKASNDTLLKTSTKMSIRLPLKGT